MARFGHKGVQIGTPTGGDPGADNLNVSGVIQKDGSQVVGARKTGWTIATGTASRATFDTVQLVQRVFAMQQDLGITAGGHGLVDARRTYQSCALGGFGTRLRRAFSACSV